MDKTKKIIEIIALLVLVLALCYGIASALIVSNQGSEYKVKIMPYDPSDIVRGKYVNVTLDIEDEYFCKEFDSFASNDDKKEFDFIDEKEYYLKLSTGLDGFLDTGKDIYTTKPEGDYLVITDVYNVRQIDGTVRISQPVYRYFVNEKLVSYYESAIRKADAYAIIKVHNGKVAFKEIMIGDETIDEYVKKLKDTESLFY